MKSVAWVGLLLCSSAFSQDLVVATPSPPVLPEYRCHAPKAGTGMVLSTQMRKRLEATATMTAAAAAVAVLEELEGSVTRNSARSYPVAYELAWRYQELGRRDELRATARRVIENPYVVGRMSDGMWGLLAQSYADEGDWARVVSLLQPMVDASCRQGLDPARKLLAAASIHLEQFTGALAQFDRMCMIDKPEELQWIRSALQVDCKHNGAAACVKRVLRYAEKPLASGELQELLNSTLLQLSEDAIARPLMDEARERGALTAEHRVIAKPTAEIEELVPRVRVAPQYPRAAAEAGQSGFVKLGARIDVDGRVIDAWVKDASPPGVFDHVSLDAMMKASFEPKIVDGQPQVAEGEYEVRFTIESFGSAPTPAPGPEPSPPRCR